MNYQKDKFINAILFFAKNTNPNVFGITKLMKLLFYSDFVHYQRYGRPILGDEYFRGDRGPIPTHSYDIYKEKIKTGLEKNIKVVCGKRGEYEMEKIEVLQDYDSGVFSKSDIEILSEMAKKFFNNTGTDMVKKTHDIIFVKEAEGSIFPIDYNEVIRSKNDKEYLDNLKREQEEVEAALNF